MDVTVRVESMRAFSAACLVGFALLAWVLAWAGGCSDKKVILGEQCPSPLSGRATVEGAADAGQAGVYGTSCAPCEDSKPRLDSQGCPIFVTFESCGGDICLGETLIAQVLPPDADAGAADAGDDRDAGAAIVREDAGE